MDAESQQPDLRSEMVRVGSDIASAVEALAVAVKGEACRPSDLTRKLGLDKTLAGRLMRAARAESPFATLVDSPTAQGFNIVLAAAGTRAIAPEILSNLESARDGLDALVDRVGGARSDLDVILSGFLPDRFERDTLAAQQSVYRAMTHVNGCSIESHEVQAWYAASEERPDRVDHVWLNASYGLRVLRGATPLILGGAYDSDDEITDQRMSLDGKPAGSDPRAWLVDDMTDLGGAEPSVLSDPPVNLLMLKEDSVPLATPLRFVLGSRILGAFRRYNEGDNKFEQSIVYPRIPTARLNINFFVDRELGWGEPTSSPFLNVLPLGIRLGDPDRGAPDRAEEVVDLRRIEGGINEAMYQMRPMGPRIVERVLTTSGWDIDRFEAWRVTVDHPIPLVAIHTWFPLPERPST